MLEVRNCSGTNPAIAWPYTFLQLTTRFVGYCYFGKRIEATPSNWFEKGDSIVRQSRAVQLIDLTSLCSPDCASFGLSKTDFASLGAAALLWGLGDAVLNTQISALLGICFPENTVRVCTGLSGKALVGALSVRKLRGRKLPVWMVVRCEKMIGCIAVSQHNRSILTHSFRGAQLTAGRVSLVASRLNLVCGDE